jgi:hypothetical protein
MVTKQRRVQRALKLEGFGVLNCFWGGGGGGKGGGGKGKKKKKITKNDILKEGGQGLGTGNWELFGVSLVPSSQFQF